MSGCKIGFNSKDNALTHKLYEGLIEQGVTCEDLDVGYRIRNYAGKYCPVSDDNFCLLGEKGVIEKQEVWAYALNHNEKYRQLIEDVLGRPLPWVLDDLDPSTTIDARIRERVTRAIDKLDEVLTKKGLKRESDDYKELMAVGLFYLMYCPNNPLILQADPESVSVFEESTKELKELGLEEYQDFLRSNGGFNLRDTSSREYSAIEAIVEGYGTCTEKTKIIYAIFRMAGLDPQFVYVDNATLRASGYEEYVKNLTSSHVCIALKIGGKWRFFDASLNSSNIEFDNYYLETPRQFLSHIYTTRGAYSKSTDQTLLEYARAIEIDPDNDDPYLAQASIWHAQGNGDAAIQGYKRVIEINPENIMAYVTLSKVYLDTGNLDFALENIEQAFALDSENDTVYLYRGAVFFQKREFEKATADFDQAIKLNPENDAAYLLLGHISIMQEDMEGALRNYSRAIDINPVNIQARFNRGGILYNQGNREVAFEDFAIAVEHIPSYLVPSMLNQYAEPLISEVDRDQLDEAISVFSGYIKYSTDKSKMVERLFPVVLEAEKERWSSTPELSMVASTFQADTGGLVIAGVEAKFILSYSFWQAGEKEQAKKELGIISQAITVSSNLSQTTQDFLKNMLDLMPESMRETDEAQEMRVKLKLE